MWILIFFDNLFLSENVFLWEIKYLCLHMTTLLFCLFWLCFGDKCVSLCVGNQPCHSISNDPLSPCMCTLLLGLASPPWQTCLIYLWCWYWTSVMTSADIRPEQDHKALKTNYQPLLYHSLKDLCSIVPFKIKFSYIPSSQL